MSKARFLKGSAVLTCGGMVSAACGFARNILIARLISVEDFGIAATFAMTMSLIEMASNLALDKMIIQAPDGEDKRLLATAHAFQVARGVVAGIVLFAAAGLFASLFDVPEVAWAFRVIALVPLIRSLGHLDVSRFQRAMRYRPLVLMETAPQLLATAVAAPIAIWLGDYRVMLWVVLIQVSVTTLVSHAVAEHPYRWAWDGAIIRRMVRFGWPLLIDGALIFAAFHGEKVIVGGWFSVEHLGWYSAAVTLAMAPSLLATTVFSRLLLPGLAARQADPPAFQTRYAISAHVYTLVGLVFAVGMAVGGGSLLVGLYGQKYAAGVSVMPWLAFAFGVRIARNGQSLCAIAHGRTSIAMAANIVRALAIGLAVAFVWFGFSIVWISAAALIGEVAAYLFAHHWVKVKLGATTPQFVPSNVFVAVFLVIAMLVQRWLISIEAAPWIAVLVACVLSGVAGSLFVLGSSLLRGQAATLTNARKRHGTGPEGSPEPESIGSNRLRSKR